MINISFSKPTDLNTVSVFIFNISGEDTNIRFYSNGQNMISEDTSGLMTGEYILQMTVGNKTQSVQILSKN